MISHGRNAGIFINGSDLSGDLNEVNPTSEQELADVTAFGNVGHTFYPGLSKDKVTIQALYNNTEKAVFEGLTQLPTGYALMIAFGSVLGSPAYATNECMLITNNMKTVVTDVNRATINLDVDNYPFEPCVLLTTGKQTIVASGQGSSVNNGSASATTGGAAYLQIFSVSTGGTLTVSVQDSNTGAFAGEQTTTCTFAAASTSGTQRIGITSQIQQYTRAVWVDTTSTCTFALALNRK